jgi:xyloglucan-specific exo-beta-1,4-glucanase
MLSGSRNAALSSASTIAELVLKGIVSLCVCVLLLAGALSAQAEGYVWRDVKVGGGGYIPDIIFSPVERGLVYLRTDMGGIYRWKADEWVWLPLQDDNPEPNYRGIESIAPDPVEPNVVYAAVGTYRNGPSAILRSSDRGDNWEIVPVPFRMGGNEEGRGLGERLAIDPNLTSVLYFGSRYDGLQRSTDRGKTWSKVASFPIAGIGVPEGRQRPHAGLSFVVFDPETGGKGAPSRTIFVGVADPGDHHLFRSDDAGLTWTAVADEPRGDLLPAQAQLDDKGILYIAYSNSMGPYGVSGGAVFKLDTHSGAWTDITPPKKGGYMGISLDRQRPDTLVVATLDLDDTIGDSIYRSTDGGGHWQDLRPLSIRDVSAAPFLLWGATEAKFGWWMTGLAIDPFDSNHVAYTTGATIYVTHDLTNAERGETVDWRTWVRGVEQTAVLTLVSPPRGAHLLSGFGDIGGFTHLDLDESEPMQSNPIFINTNNFDYAELAPNVIVRSGSHEAHAKVRTATLGYSTDFGETWNPLYAPVPKGYVELAPEKIPYNFSDPYIDAAIVTSADGKTFIVMTPGTPVLTRSHGKNWVEVKGLPPGGRPVPDRADPKRFYAVDFDNSVVYVSNDGGHSFKPQRTVGLPSDIKADRPHGREAHWPLIATPNKKGDLWYISQGRLFHSTDGGRRFAEVESDLAVSTFDFGKAAPGKRDLTLYAIGDKDGVSAIWRSEDNGQSWLRLNDARHEYSRVWRCIAGDKNVFGRVYVGTDGRGIVYGEPRK